MRPFVLEDAPLTVAWLQDPEVMRFSVHGVDASPAVTEDRLRRYMAHQERYGFSRWLVLERASGEPIGDAGLLWLEEVAAFELGYRLRRDRWGQGLATEIAAAWVDFAWNELGLERFIAYANRRNLPSIRVLQKLGLRYVRAAFVEGIDAVIYEGMNPNLPSREPGRRTAR